MRKKDRWLRIILTAIILGRIITSAEIIATSETGATFTFPSSAFLYYGPPSKSLADAEAIFFPEQYFCKESSESIGKHIEHVVKNKVVFDFWGCEFDKAFGKFENAGALAYVRIMFYSGSPGLLTFHHNTWSTSKHRDASMTALEVTMGDIGAQVITSWETSRMQGWQVTIKPQHVRLYQDAFESISWLLSMRIFLPLAAFYACAEACFEFRRIRKLLSKPSPDTNYAPLRRTAQRSMRMIGLAIVSIEAPSLLCVGLLLAFGHYGPTALPAVAHWGLFFFLFSGLSVASTVLLALLIREEALASQGFPGHDLFAHYRLSLSAVFVTCFGWEVASAYAAAYGVNNGISVELIWGIVSLGLLAIQASAGVYFLVQAGAFAKCLALHLNSPMGRRQPRNAKRIARLVFWLYASGVATLFSNVLILCFLGSIAGFISPDTASPYFTGAFLFTLARIMVPYSQISTIKPQADSPIRAAREYFMSQRAALRRRTKVRPSKPFMSNKKKEKKKGRELRVRFKGDSLYQVYQYVREDENIDEWMGRSGEGSLVISDEPTPSEREAISSVEGSSAEWSSVERCSSKEYKEPEEESKRVIEGWERT